MHFNQTEEEFIAHHIVTPVFPLGNSSCLVGKLQFPNGKTGTSLWKLLLNNTSARTRRHDDTPLSIRWNRFINTSVKLMPLECTLNDILFRHVKPFLKSSIGH